MKTQTRRENDVNETEAQGADTLKGGHQTEAVAVHPLTEEELEQLKVQAAKSDEYWDQLLRTAADLDNFKKRAAREKQEAIRYANESLLQKLIPVLDNFEMALAAVSTAAGAEAGTAESLQTGVSMIQQQLKQALSDAGLEEINAANLAFDPNYHEAVSQQESAEVPEGHVLQQLRKGYKLKDRLLRPATVIVAKKPAGTPA
ncbi:MAG: nucleotide exchange factor GrpE [Verrucomicrobia subdivision 3 bacterium]|nr:nucleotide exchange factor GrpE [Limisphaerales bacterium]